MGKAVGKLFGEEGGDENFAKAQRAFSKAQALSDEAIARNKSYLENWERLFGNLEENVAAYVNSLNPDVQSARTLAAFEEEYSQNLDSIKQNYTKRFGEVSASGLAEAGEINAQLSAAKIRAQVKANAEQQVFEQQAQVYGKVVGQRATGRAALNKAFQNASGTNLDVGKQQVALGKYRDQQQAQFGREIIGGVVRGIAAVKTLGASEALRPDGAPSWHPKYSGPITQGDLEG